MASFAGPPWLSRPGRRGFGRRRFLCRVWGRHRLFDRRLTGRRAVGLPRLGGAFFQPGQVEFGVVASFAHRFERFQFVDRDGRFIAGRGNRRLFDAGRTGRHMGGSVDPRVLGAEDNRTDRQQTAGCHRRLVGHARLADKRAVERAQISHPQLAVGFEHFAVPATHQGVGQGQVGGSTASDDGGQLQRELTGLRLGAAHDNQLHFHLSLLRKLARNRLLRLSSAQGDFLLYPSRNPRGNRIALRVSGQGFWRG